LLEDFLRKKHRSPSNSDKLAGLSRTNWYLRFWVQFEVLTGVLSEKNFRLFFDTCNNGIQSESPWYFYY